MPSLASFGLNIEFLEEKKLWLGLSPDLADSANLQMCVVLQDIDTHDTTYVPYIDLFEQPRLLDLVRKRIEHIIHSHALRIPFRPRVIPCGVTWNMTRELTRTMLPCIHNARFHTTDIPVASKERPSVFSVGTRAAWSNDTCYRVLARMARMLEFELLLLDKLEEERANVSSDDQRKALIEFETNVRLEAYLSGMSPRAAERKDIVRKLRKVLMYSVAAKKADNSVAETAADEDDPDWTFHGRAEESESGPKSVPKKRRKKGVVPQSTDATEASTKAEDARMPALESPAPKKDRATSTNPDDVSPRKHTRIRDSTGRFQTRDVDAAAVHPGIHPALASAVELEWSSQSFTLARIATMVPTANIAPVPMTQLAEACTPVVASAMAKVLATGPSETIDLTAQEAHAPVPCAEALLPSREKSRPVKRKKAQPTEPATVTVPTPPPATKEPSSSSSSSDTIVLTTPSSTLFPILNDILQNFLDPKPWEKLLQLSPFTEIWHQFAGAPFAYRHQCELNIRLLISMTAGSLATRPPILLSTLSTIIRGCPHIRKSDVVSNVAMMNYVDMTRAMSAGNPNHPSARHAIADIIGRHENVGERAALTAFVEQKSREWSSDVIIAHTKSSKASLDMLFAFFRSWAIVESIVARGTFQSPHHFDLALMGAYSLG